MIIAASDHVYMHKNILVCGKLISMTWLKQYSDFCLY